ncbi:MAG: CRTAC1 family protein [Gemmataceae bacterium]|nr:CRTAC1 family protein [Gemmataceae bacterium]
MKSSASRWIALLAGVAAVLLVLVVFREKIFAPESRPTDHPAANLKPTAGVPWFVNVAAQSGIAFQHFDSATEMQYIQETVGSGLGWIDYDGDGWLDLFCVQDGPIFPEQHKGPPPTHKLYRNNGDGSFADVTEQAGLARSGYGMGCAVGDFDNDGFDDLVVTYLGRIELYHNQPDGRGGRKFLDVTAQAGLRDPHWATSCAWGDIDGDGFLDLYVCNYSEIDLKNYQPCVEPKTKLRYACAPTVFPSVHHLLFRNKGNGAFSDITHSSNVGSTAPAPGFAVITVDLDGDGLQDIYVANDMKPAYLFQNQGNGKLLEGGLLSGSALQPNGRFIAGMGVDVGDVDGSGRPSLFVTNFQREPNMLFLNLGKMLFKEWSYPSGLGGSSISRLAFGALFCDIDLDGALDVAVANGHVVRNSQEVFNEPFAQEAQLYLGDGKANFRDVSAQAGPYFHEKWVGRGLAWADYNNDGLPDLAWSNNGGPAALLRNATDTKNHWIRLELVGDPTLTGPSGRKSSRNAVGAKVEIETGGKKLVRFVTGGGSYLSASDRRLLVGLGDAERVDRVSVLWPSGRRQTFGPLDGRQSWRLFEGREQPEHLDHRSKK